MPSQLKGQIIVFSYFVRRQANLMLIQVTNHLQWLLAKCLGYIDELGRVLRINKNKRNRNDGWIYLPEVLYCFVIITLYKICGTSAINDNAAISQQLPRRPWIISFGCGLLNTAKVYCLSSLGHRIRSGRSLNTEKDKKWN
jgi:hypothetical protein